MKWAKRGDATRRSCMLSLFFHNWERRLADVSKDRVVRPVRVGTRLDSRATGTRQRRAALERAEAYVASALTDTQAWFTAPPCDAYDVDARRAMGRRG